MLIGDCSSTTEGVLAALAGVGTCDNHTVCLSSARLSEVPLMLHFKCTLPLIVRGTAACPSVRDSSQGQTRAFSIVESNCITSRVASIAKQIF